MTPTAGERIVVGRSSLLRRRMKSLIGLPLRIDTFVVEAGYVPVAAPEYCVEMPENGWFKLVNLR